MSRSRILLISIVILLSMSSALCRIISNDDKLEVSFVTDINEHEGGFDVLKTKGDIFAKTQEGNILVFWNNRKFSMKEAFIENNGRIYYLAFKKRSLAPKKIFTLKGFKNTENKKEYAAACMMKHHNNFQQEACFLITHSELAEIYKISYFLSEKLKLAAYGSMNSKNEKIIGLAATYEY